MAGLMVVLGLVTPTPALGQTRFAWPDTTVDVSTYTTVDQCLSALDRVKRTMREREGRLFVRDTLRLDPRDALGPTPAPVTETAQRCATRFAEVDSVPLKGFDFFLALYLNADWDSKAQALVSRRVSAVAPQAKHERAAVIDTAVSIYLGWGGGMGGEAANLLAASVQPARIAAAEALLTGMAHELSDRVERMVIYDRLMKITLTVADTARAEAYAARIVATADSLTASERQTVVANSDSLGMERMLVYDARRLQSHRALLDSLRHGTAAYVALARGVWTRTTQLRPEVFGAGMPIGEHAPVIQGDFWFGHTDSGTVYPRSGHVSLVVFLDDQVCMPAINVAAFSEDRWCWNVWATARRLATRFPALEITVVTQTHGFFQDVVPPTPSEEARLMQQWMAVHGVSATLAVTNTPFWRLPAPDSRRIEQPIPNFTHYTFGKSWPVRLGSAFLIDQDGIIVHSKYGGLSNDSESEYSELIDILLSRHLVRH